MKTRLLLTLTAALLALSSWANGTEIDGIHYELDSSTGTASVTYTGSSSSDNTYSGDITIPASVTYSGTTYSVTSIRDFAFYNCTGLTSITIPSSVTSIGRYAFYGCKGLTSVTIPSSVTSIDYAAFSGCTGLTSIKVEAGNTKYDSRDNCNAIIETASNTLVAGCKTTTIPESVTSFGSSAFRGCTGLTSITIPNSVTSIEYATFSGCAGLTSITIPSSVTSIGERAFEGCTGLTSITIPSSVTSIGGYAFSDCTGLTSITIPSSVTSIGDRAFRGCTGLTSITACKMDPSEYNCHAIAFDNVPYSSVTLYVPAGSASAYRALEPWRYFSNNIVETDLTSIQTPTINSSETIVGYYNLQGQRIAEPQHGQLVIVRYSDGTSRKMYVR